MRSLRLARHREQPDAGFSVIELVVSIGIFMTVIGIFMSAVVVMSHNTVKVQAVADAGADVRKAFQRMDKQVRYTDAINIPGAGASGATYVEIRTPASVAASGYTTCTQWRWDPNAKTLAMRTWRDGTGTPGAFQTIVEHVVPTTTGSPATTVPALQLKRAAPTHPRQELVVNVTVLGAEKRTVSSQASFVARNSSAESDGNLDANLDNVSDRPACWKTGVRP